MSSFRNGTFHKKKRLFVSHKHNFADQGFQQFLKNLLLVSKWNMEVLKGWKWKISYFPGTWSTWCQVTINGGI